VKVSFLIVNWNSGDLLRTCLASLDRQTFRDFEVVVVDNGSQDGSCDVPSLDAPGRHVIRAKTNLGFSEANNEAFRQSTGAYIVLLNNDVTLEPDWTERVVRHLDAHPGTASVACRLMQQHEPRRLDSAGFAWYTCGTVFAWYGWPAGAPAQTGHRILGPVAAAAAYRRTALEQTGLFHPAFFAYYEDTDLAARLALWGHRCDYLPDAVGHHLGSATGRRHSDFHRYHLRRNIEFVYWLNMQGGLAWSCLLPHLAYEALAFAGMLWRGQGRVFLRAKRDAWRQRAWLRSERRRLREALDRSLGLAQAVRNLRTLLTPSLRLPADRWASSRLPPPSAA